MKDLRIALLQLDDEGSRDANLRSGLAACESAAGEGADIALLPEAWSHGYRFFEPGDAQAQAQWRASALAEDSAFVAAHRDAARRLGIAIGCTLISESPEGPRNTILVIDRHGEIVLRYSKVHTCQHSAERHCAPGDRFHVAEVDTAAGPVSLGAMICYDREFPESARILGILGAEVVLVPNACLFDGHRLAQLRTRAFENKMTIALANYPATHPDSDGRSVGISGIAFGREHLRATPTNQQAPYRENLLVEAGRDAAIVSFDVGLEELRDYRRNAIWGTPHRRVAAYGALLDPDRGPPFAPDHIIS